MTSMLLATAICFGFVIEMCSSAATNSQDLYDGVFVCVENNPEKNASSVTWTLAAYIQDTCCDLLYHVYFERKTSSESNVISNLSPSGTFQLTTLRDSVVYVIQMTCLAPCNSPGKSYRSSEVSFLSGSTSGKVCSKTHPVNLSQGQISVCIYKTQGEFNHVVQWSSTQTYGPTSCALRYTSLGTTETQHRTEIFRDLPMNSSLFLTEGATDVQVNCNDSNNDMQSSGILTYPRNDQPLRACSVSPDLMLPVTTRTPATKPTHYRGLQVSSLTQGLALAFSIVIVSSLMALLAYKRYKSYMRRRSQRLLRVETEEEANEEAAMQEFQRMV